MRLNNVVSPTRRTRLSIALIAALIGSFAFIHRAFYTPPVHALSTSIVISQVYGGGGNSGATLRNDFIELFNRGTSPVDLSGWSVQYASSAGTTWQRTNLTAVILQPGQYYLVQQAQGAGGTLDLPAPDATGTIAMSATAGKVALVNNQTTITSGTSCPTGANIVDFVGYGAAANCFEGAGPTATLSNTTAALRGTSGCTETDNNSTDFTTGAPTPRNTASPLNVCPVTVTLSINDVTVTEGDAGTVTASFTVSLSSPAGAGGVTFDIATADDSATVADNDYISRTLIGQSILSGEPNYTFDVTVNGDTNLESNETFLVNVTNVTGATVSDGQGVGTINNDDCPPPAADVVISQIYGGGGNSGAPFTNDFIELYNRSTTTVSLAGWSVQYASAAGTSWQVTPLSGSIAPGGYYLIHEGGGVNGVPLPTPDATGTINMAAGAGKVALSSSTTAFSGACPTCFVDFVGYGGANCFEGSNPAGGLSNTTSASRKRGGCFDSNNNSVDFSVGSPNPRNSATPTRSCTFTPAQIHDLQGNGAVTPFLGQDVITIGIVTARKSNGFFLQTPDSGVDADPNTSQGIFVFTSSAPTVAVGDAVSTQGTAGEFFNLTQIESSLPGDVQVASSANPLPAAITLTASILDPAGSPTQLERFEGMLMHGPSLVSVAPSNQFGETFTVLAGVPRPLREPGIEVGLPIPPDPTTGVPDCCIPTFDLNPERIMIDSDGVMGAAPIHVTSNVTFSNVTGPLDFTFGNYKLLPTTAPTVSANMSAVPVPATAANEFTVAGYNIENFNNNSTQRLKAALAIRTVLNLPDIIGHIEIASLAALEALAEQVNDDTVAAGGADPMYQAYLIPFGPNDQHVGYLVKTSRVQVNAVTQERAADTFINPNTGLPETLHDRPPLVLRATVNPGALNEVPVIVVVNHLRSFIDIELVGGDGPRVRAKRKAQAESLAGLLQELQTDNPTTPVISIGDYNAFQFNDGYTDPIATIKGTPTADEEMVVDESPDLVNPDFYNLTDELPADQRYSFIFQDTPQALDHVIVNSVARSLVTRYTIARNNSDFPESPGALFFSDPTRPERNSDHDIPVAYFFAKATTTTSVSDVTATYSSMDQALTLTANVTATTGTVNEGSVTFTVTDGSNTIVGLPVMANVNSGVASASYTLPGGTQPQALTITGVFSGGDLTHSSNGTGTLNVTYGICLLYDPTKEVRSGAAYPIKIQLCELDGTNASASDITVLAEAIEQISTSTQHDVIDSGNANPDNNFRFDSSLGTTGGYVFNLRTTGLASSVYKLIFSVEGDPLPHEVEFVIK